MNKFILTIIIAVSASFLTGCASTKAYFSDRGRDAMDIVTVTAGWGAGAKARVGPFHTGLFCNQDQIGLRGGRLALFGTQTVPQLFDFDTLVIPVTFFGPCFGFEWFEPDQVTEASRYKEFSSFYSIPFWGLPVRTGSDDDPAAPFKLNRHNLPYFTQIELAAGLGPTVRIGVNPGELLDFILGWVGIDIYDDDAKSLKRVTGLKGTDLRVGQDLNSPEPQ